MKHQLHILFCLLLLSFAGLAQDHFLVELENRSPDVKAQVQAYENYPVIPFLAKGVDGVEYASNGMKGKITYLWFWNQNCPKCIEHIDALNKMQNTYGSSLQVLSFSDNSKKEILDFKTTKTIDFPIIPNSKVLADGPFGGDFGYPRLFIVDENGIIKYVIPEIEMRGNFDAFGFFEAVHRSLQKG